MSLRARLTLAASALFAGGTIWFVHWNQTNEREVGGKLPPFYVKLSESDCLQTMYKGVLRDEKRVAEKKAQREEQYRISLAKRERYEAVQTVLKSDTS